MGLANYVRHFPLTDTIFRKTILPNVWESIPGKFRDHVKEEILDKLLGDSNDGSDDESVVNRDYLKECLALFFPGIFERLGSNHFLRSTGSTDGHQLCVHYWNTKRRTVKDIKSLPLLHRYEYEDVKLPLAPPDIKEDDAQIAVIKELQAKGFFKPINWKIQERQRERRARLPGRDLCPVVKPRR